MKASALIIFFSFICLFTQAQDYAIINDKDGFVNVRKGSNSQSEIIGKLYNKDIFLCDSESETTRNWIRIYKQQNDGDLLDGYVSESRIYHISKFPNLRVKKTGINSCSLKNDSLFITIQSSKFNIKNHKLSINEKGTLVDNKLIWGTDDRFPHQQITPVRVIINDKNVNIPNIAFKDLYEPNYRNFNVYLGRNETIYIEMDNSDGAGAYTVFWIIKDGKYYGRYIDSSMA